MKNPKIQKQLSYVFNCQLIHPFSLEIQTLNVDIFVT